MSPWRQLRAPSPHRIPVPTGRHTLQLIATTAVVLDGLQVTPAA
ncbi:hypothetical protein [Salinispora fenicalii]|nr:hypothetical protein [Salinispora fenicalii]